MKYYGRKNALFWQAEEVRIAGLLLLVGLLIGAVPDSPVRFVIIGDRTGQAQPGVYEQVWKEAAEEHPDFVINVGDTIQGPNLSEWNRVKQMLRPFSQYQFFYTPGNHDVWDEESAAAYRQATGRPLHYSFNKGPVHISVLDNSRTEDLPPSELNWLAEDLENNKTKPAKFVFMHRPSWLLYAVMQNPDFPLQKLAKQRGVRYVVAGHVHEMMHFDVDGTMYLSMPSSGGHLRNTKRYEDGWFFAHTLVTVRGGKAGFEIKEARAPHGAGRSTHPDDWGAAGLIHKPLTQ